MIRPGGCHECGRWLWNGGRNPGTCFDATSPLPSARTPRSHWSPDLPSGCSRSETATFPGLVRESSRDSRVSSTGTAPALPWRVASPSPACRAPVRCWSSSGGRDAMGRRTSRSTRSTSWGGWPCWCRGRGSISSSTTVCWRLGRAWRSAIVPRPVFTDGGVACSHEPADTTGRRPAERLDTASRRARGRLWADLMQRTFGLDVLACARCGGRLRLIALIEEAAVIRRILRHLGLPETVPTPSPARAPPLPLRRHANNSRYDLDADDVEAP